MKSIYILTGILTFVIMTDANAQDYSPSTTEDTTMAKLDADAGEFVTIFNTPMNATRSGECSLIQNTDRPMKVTYKKNGYKMVTKNKDEIVHVQNKKNGDKKLTYYNNFETLDYHQKNNGQNHYKYTYYNECKKVKVKKNKKGVIYVTNKAEVDRSRVQANVKSAIQRGAYTCTTNKYSR